MELSVRAAATLLVLQATGGIAATNWLPTDSQVLYRIAPGEIRRLELNTSRIPETPVYITVSPCSRDFRWEVYGGSIHCDDDKLKLIYETSSEDTKTFSKIMSNLDRYVLQLSSVNGGAAAVSARGEPSQRIRLRLRARSKRRLFASWDPSPIDPQATTYCVVASHKRNYTSLCAAQYDAKLNRLETKSSRNAGRLDFNARNVDDESSQEDNKIYKETGLFDMYEGNFKSFYRRKKFSRSTRITDEDPVIACVGDRTHHTIENLDSIKNYSVSIFGVGNDKRAGSILALATLRTKTATARCLRPDQPYKAELKNNRMVFYYKGAFSVGDGLWLSVTACGGPVDVEVLVRGKRISFFTNIDRLLKFFAPAPILTSSAQDSSDEGSMQFDSSSDETRLKYVIKVAPSWPGGNANVIHMEVLASLNQWGANSPELAPVDGAVVREIRTRRSCRSLHIAFLPAIHHTADYIRYCITARESGIEEDAASCSGSKGADVKQQCINQSPRARSKVIMQKITGLRTGRKYIIQVTAATKTIAVPYKILYADTNSCKN